MRYQTTFTWALLCLAVFKCQAASLNLDESCKFEAEKGECVTVSEKPKPDNKDIYCKDFYEISGRPVVPLALKEGKHPALLAEFPHMVAIGFPSKTNVTNWACGGTLISKTHVLTSGICLKNKQIGEAKFVRLGDLNIRSEEAGPHRQTLNIKKVFIHPDFKRPSFYNDIGIAELEKPIEITPYAFPACLNTKAEIPLKELYTAAGYGVDRSGQSSDRSLQKVILNIIENKECREKLKSISGATLPNGIDDALYICAGAPNTNTCQGDAGGPLQQTHSGFTVVYGVISFGAGLCEKANLPEVHTRVSKYIDWIKSVIE